MITAALTPRRAATRDRLMDAAVALFAERGVLGASVEEISDRAGFTRGAFYSNFGSKDELVLALLHRETEAQIGNARRVISEVLTDVPAGGDPSARIGRTVDAFFDAQRPEREWVVVERELKLYAIRNPGVAAEFRDFEQRSAVELGQLISDALAAVGREFSVPTEQALAMVIAIYEYAVLGVLTEQAPHRAPRELLTTLVGVISRPTTLPG